jgi:hypothetical protein
LHHKPTTDLIALPLHSTKDDNSSQTTKNPKEKKNFVTSQDTGEISLHKNKFQGKNMARSAVTKPT